MKIKLLKNERAMVFGDFLVVSDLHIGYETELSKRGFVVPSQVNGFIKKITELQRETGAKKLLLLGDVKHNIPLIAYEEKYDVPNFFREVGRQFEEVIIVKGNHDGRIERMVHEDNVRIVSEHIVGDTGFMHGHKVPSKQLLECKTIIMGHAHPAFKFVDELGVRHVYPCWLFGKMAKKTKKYKEAKIENVVVVPCFNALFTGYEKFAGPLSKHLKVDAIYLLDLTKVK
jgi:hypothetical protein